MRWRIAHVAAASSFALAHCPQARASDCSPALSTCIDDDTLWPHAGPARFVFIGSTDTVSQGDLGFGLTSTYLSRPIVVHVSTPGGPGTNEPVVDNQVNGTFLWAYGLTSRLELDIALPVTFFQNGTGLAPVTGGQALPQTAQRDVRFGWAFAVLRPPPSALADRDGFSLLGRFEVSAPTGDRDRFAGEASGVYAPSMDAQLRLGRWYAGAELGARLRATSELLGARVGSQLVAALGSGFDVLAEERLSVGVEAWALPTFAEQNVVTSSSSLAGEPASKHIAPAEWQLSLRSSPLASRDLSIQVGGGGAIPFGSDVVTQPRFRFTLGVRWAPSSEKAQPSGVGPERRP